ncbi:MAG: hypothetical protein WBP64_08740 [Nitrososphaeraceae archaeon]
MSNIISSKYKVFSHTIKHIPSTPNSTIDAGYFVVPNYMNESMGYITAKVKYAGIGVGPAYGLNGTTWRMDMNVLVYPEVITVRACIQDCHFKLNTDEFNDCYRCGGAH